jgi:hypothetical protein
LREKLVYFHPNSNSKRILDDLRAPLADRGEGGDTVREGLRPALALDQLQQHLYVVMYPHFARSKPLFIAPNRPHVWSCKMCAAHLTPPSIRCLSPLCKEKWIRRLLEKTDACSSQQPAKCECEPRLKTKTDARYLCKWGYRERVCWNCLLGCIEVMGMTFLF